MLSRPLEWRHALHILDFKEGKAMATEWHASSLQNNFARRIVGFDLRRGASLSRLFMASYDESARYEEFNERHKGQTNGMNLFYADPSDHLKGIPSDAWIVAFDLPDGLVLRLLNGNVSSPYPLPPESLGNEWKFAGFDVIDPITQTSFLNGFDDIDGYGLIVSGKIELNAYSLIDDDIAAIRISTDADRLIPEHSPFAPCGIWLKSATHP